MTENTPPTQTTPEMMGEAQLLTLISTAKVMKKISCGRTKLNSLMRTDPTFPKPIRFSPTFIRWNVADIDMWIKSKMG